MTTRKMETFNPKRWLKNGSFPVNLGYDFFFKRFKEEQFDVPN